MFKSCQETCGCDGENGSACCESSVEVQQTTTTTRHLQIPGEHPLVQSPRGSNVNLSVNAGLHATHESVRSVTVDEKTDRSKAVEISEQKDRQWVAITAYQPIDTVVKTVEVPVVRTVETYVPKIQVEEKIIEVPKYIPEYVEKVVEVPEVQIVDKIVEVPQYQYQYKYVPKIETKGNIIERPKYETKYIEKIVEVPQIKEVVRYQDVEEIEEVIRYVPKGQAVPEEWKKTTEVSEVREVVDAKATATSKPETYITQAVELPSQRQDFVSGMPPEYSTIPGMPPPQTRVEQVFKPKVVKTVEIQKHVPISVDVPVPYMVPKPVVIPVQVPVLRFRDHFVPVPVRRRVVPRIRWTNEVYEVECIKEKPFLQVQDIIKPVPCDVEIKVHEFVEKAQPINPAELSQADIHAMWMRVNADLAEKKKEEYGEKYPYVKHADGTVFGEPGISQEDEEEEEMEGGLELSDEERAKRKEERLAKKREAEAKGLEPLALHPGHPLAMTYLQNEWIKKETTSTHQMYSPEWFEQHQKAFHHLHTQLPTQVQIQAEQAQQLRPHEASFGDAPWLETDAQGLPPPLHQVQEEVEPCKLCGLSCQCC